MRNEKRREGSENTQGKRRKNRERLKETGGEERKSEEKKAGKEKGELRRGNEEGRREE